MHIVYLSRLLELAAKVRASFLFQKLVIERSNIPRPNSQNSIYVDPPGKTLEASQLVVSKSCMAVHMHS